MKASLSADQIRDIIEPLKIATFRQLPDGLAYTLYVRTADPVANAVNPIALSCHSILDETLNNPGSQLVTIFRLNGGEKIYSYETPEAQVFL